MNIRIFAVAAIIGVLFLTIALTEALRIPKAACLDFCIRHGYDSVGDCKQTSIYCKKNETLFNSSGYWYFHAVYAKFNGSWSLVDYHFEIARSDGGFQMG